MTHRVLLARHQHHRRPDLGARARADALVLRIGRQPVHGGPVAQDQDRAPRLVLGRGHRGRRGSRTRGPGMAPAPTTVSVPANAKPLSTFAAVKLFDRAARFVDCLPMVLLFILVGPSILVVCVMCSSGFVRRPCPHRPYGRRARTDHRRAVLVRERCDGRVISRPHHHLREAWWWVARSRVEWSPEARGPAGLAGGAGAVPRRRRGRARAARHRWWRGGRRDAPPGGYSARWGALGAWSGPSWTSGPSWRSWGDP